MSGVLRYLSHPQVRVDPAVAVPDWGLSDIGRSRTESVSHSHSLQSTTSIISSSERKAVETADMLARPLKLKVQERPATHENDRSATGFLSPDVFEDTANRFFERPHQSIDGWERAIDAQGRIVTEVISAIQDHGAGDLLIVGHGGVGTLLYCYFASVPISRAFDQPAGGGNFFKIDLATRHPIHHWLPMEEL
ncbi:histidine phosphatase family protein [Pararhizobium sp. IMCC21322]|uniref:histidine phosphatase family protein n=1 Tax=Pararhizobium sp. IMCC21322 TaxID=3067903 RepID=UPI002741F03A|nr:histidine phosphatase family protein [Pararhizobium sp. IMCC21322]